MTPPIDRVRYYDGEYLRAFDFADEQTYHMEMRRRLNMALHLWGIVEGLDITKDTEAGITQYAIEPGMAIDPYGREILVFAPYVLDETVLTANQETEDGLIAFLKAQERTRLQKESVDAGQKAVKAIQDLWTGGLLTDYTRVAQLETTQVVLEDTLAQAEGEIALGLIQVYKALGGGWQLRCTGCPEPPITPQPRTHAPVEQIPVFPQEVKPGEASRGG